MPFVVEDQLLAAIQSLYSASGTTIFLLADVPENTLMLLRVGTDVACLKSNNMHLEQLLKAVLPIAVMPFPNVTDCRLEQLLNTCIESDVTEFGMAMLVRPVHPINVPLPNVVSPCGSVRLVKLMQFRNADVPNVSMLLGIVMLVRPLQPSKANA